MTKTTIGTANVEEGQASTTYVIPSDTTPGLHVLHATYEQTDNYMSAAVTGNAEIRITTVTTVEDVIASIGEEVTFTAHVKYNTTQNVNEGSVQFKLAGTNIGQPQSVSGGVAVLEDYEIPSSTPDDTVITAVFIETTTYGSSTGTGNLNIRGDTNVSVSNLSGNLDSDVSIVASFTDSDGQNIPSGQAELYVDGTKYGNAVNVTSGSATFTYHIANNAVLGGHIVRVVYLQNDTLELNSGEGTCQLTVRTPTVLTAVNVSANRGTNNVPVAVEVKANNLTITEGTVLITVGNGEAVEAQVGGNGQAGITYNVPNDADGTITFTAQYVENDNYQGSTMAVAGVITIRKGVVLTVENVKAELGDSITLASTVIDEDNEDVDEGIITYELE